MTERLGDPSPFRGSRASWRTGRQAGESETPLVLRRRELDEVFADFQAGESETPLVLRRRELDEVFADFHARGVGLRSCDNLTRDELYDEAARGGPDA